MKESTVTKAAIEVSKRITATMNNIRKKAEKDLPFMQVKGEK